MSRDVLGHWVGEGSESSNFWLNVVTDLQGRGVQDIFIACMDGLTGFKDAVLAVFPRTQIQRCIIHQIRNSLKYVTWKDRKFFIADLRLVYQAATREAAEAQLRQLHEKWGDKYAIAIRSWQNNWEDLATFFAYPAEIRRLIYTTNPVEGYHRQLRKVTKSKGAFPTPQAARKLLFLAHRDIFKKWDGPIFQRKDLHPFEEAAAIRRLTDQFRYTHEQIARKLGKSRTVVTEVLSLCRMPEDIQERCRHADITSKSMLLQIVRQDTTEEMHRMVDKITGEGMTREQARRYNRPEDEGRRKANRFTYRFRPEDRAFECTLSFAKAEVERNELILALQQILERLVEESREGAN